MPKDFILVTGAAGFIGSNFVRMVLSRFNNLKIVSFDKLTYAGNLDNLKETISGDLKIYSGEYLIDNLSKDIVYVSVAWSGWGKVCAARTTARILSTKFKGSSVGSGVFMIS